MSGDTTTSSTESTRDASAAPARTALARPDDNEPRASIAFNAGGVFQARPFQANANGDFPLEHSTFYAPGAPRTFVVGLRYSID